MTEIEKEHRPEMAGVRIRQMHEGDLPLGRDLVRQAGWNQRDSDWKRAMALEPGGCYVAEAEGAAVATTTGCRFGAVGWIAMVLVDTKARGRGIAGKLVSHTINYLEALGVKSIRLDATPMGQGLYRKLEFKPEYEVIRYAGTPGEAAPDSLPVIYPEDRLMKEVIAFDRKISGTEREGFLENLAKSVTTPFYYKTGETGHVRGYVTCREGGNAIQIGPAAALTSDTGRHLLNCIAARYAGRRCFIDIPVPNGHANKWALANGFTEQRRFVRMCRGEKTQDFPELIWASSGPEKG